MNYKNAFYIVYLHVSPNKKCYVGITHQNPHDRWRSGGKGYKNCPVFYNAIKKYGWNNFKHIILCEGLTYEQACEKERECIIKYNSLVPNGYNIDEGGYKGTSFKKKIIAFNEQKEIRLFDSITDAASEIGIHQTSISKVIEKPKKSNGWFFIYAS